MATWSSPWQNQSSKLPTPSEEGNFESSTEGGEVKNNRVDLEPKLERVVFVADRGTN